MRRGATGCLVRRAHRTPQLGQRLASGHRADEQGALAHCMTYQLQRERKVVDRVERADGKHQVIRAGGRVPMVLDDRTAAICRSEQRAGIASRNLVHEFAQALEPLRVRAADQQSALEAAPDHGDAIEAISEGTLVEEQLGPGARGAIPAKRAQLHVEQLGHGTLVR